MVPEKKYANPIEALRSLSHQDFLNFGLHHIAYIKPLSVNDERSWALHAADGTVLSVFSTMEEAVIATHENAMKPLRLQ